MKVRQLGSVLGTAEPRQHLTTFLINEAIAIDAGSLGLLAPVVEQRRVGHVFLSHSHVDHLATLPSFLDNVSQPSGLCPTIHASRDVWHCLRHDVFNGRLWPDLSCLTGGESQFFQMAELRSEEPVAIDGVTITPVGVDHVVPTLGFLIEDETSAIVIPSDTGPTDRIWQLANRPDFRRKLRAVFLECSFPDALEWLAVKAKHLCPKQFAAEIAKLAPVPGCLTVAVHLKATLQEAIRQELEALSLPNFEIGGADRTWEF